MAYLKKLSSLKGMATSQLAINLCQDSNFKEIAMCLEKPIIDTALWYTSDNFKKIKEWDVAIDKQCQRLTEGLPRSLQHEVHVWITRIAFEYSSYSQRMELLFKIPRYFFMNIINLQDWTETARVNEIRIADRLLKEERLTVWQRYRIACVYCLNERIPHFWNRLTSEEKELIVGKDDPCSSQEKNKFVLLWSYFMDGHREEKVTRQKNYLWAYAALQAVNCGNQETLMRCWKRLDDEGARKDIVLDGALQSLENLQNIRSLDIWRENLVLKEYCGPLRQSERVEHLNLPCYYSELLRFFLSKMSEEQRLTFFTITFEKWRYDFNSSYPSDILNCFLESPLRDHFLPMMNTLWGIVPQDIYGNCLISLAEKYSGDYDGRSSSSSFYKKEDLNYDYRSMLWNLWEETPKEYKQYVFTFKRLEHWGSYTKSVIEYLLPQLLVRSPLQETDVALFKRVWHDVPLEERKEVINEKYARNICVILVQKEMWSFLNWLLEDCFPGVEIPGFKLKFAECSIIPIICFNKLAENHEKYVEDFIDWAFESDTDKLHFKYKIIKNHGIIPCSYLLSASQYAELERIINFSLLSEERKLEIKVDIVKETCRGFLKNCVFEQMDRCISWIFDAEEKISNFKSDLFYADDFVFDLHHQLVFNPDPQWGNVEGLYKWFCLSPEKIIKLKKETVFTSRVIDVVHKALCGTMDTFYKETYGELDELVTSLQWCLTDQEMVICFKEEIEKQFCDLKCTEHNKIAKKGKKQLGNLVSKLLQSFQKEVVHEETSSENTFVNDKGEKKSLMMEDDKLISTRKRFKKMP